MKNQRMKKEARSFGFSALAVVILMLATLICSFTVMASADGNQIEITKDDLNFGSNYDSVTDTYTKEYDGTADGAAVTLTTEGLAKVPEGVTVKPTVTFNSPNAVTVGEVPAATYVTVSFTLEGDNADQYVAPRSFTLPAKISPRELDWSANGTAKDTYAYGKTSYEVAVVLPTLKTDRVVNNDNVAVVDPDNYKVVATGVAKAGSQTVALNVQLNNGNYVAKTLNVDVTIEKIQIQEISWADSYEFAWGDEAARAIKVYGYDYDENNNPKTAYELIIEYKADYGSVGTHEIKALLPDTDNMEWARNATAFTTKGVQISKKQYVVSFNDAIYVGNKGIQTVPTEFNIAVNGDIPADIRALIAYTCNGTAFTGASEYGAYTVSATLPTSENYEFVDAAGNVIAAPMSATMYVNKQYIHAGSDGAEDYEIILIGTNGFTGDVQLNVTIPEKLARKAIKGFAIHKEYTVNVTGAADQTFTVLIPISDSLYHKRCDDLTAADLYIYEDATGTMVKASEKAGYKVTLEEGHYRIDGVSGSAAVTFVIAPNYNTPFFLTAPGIALLVFLVLALIALLGLIGMYLNRIRNTEENAVLVIDEGEVPAVEPVELEDNVDADAFLDENADAIAEGIDAEAQEPETEAEGVEEAVAESMQELVDEAAAIADEEIAEEDVAAEMAEEKAEELQETVDADADAEAEADADALRDAVEAAMEENFNESADASDAVEVEEEDSVEAFAEVEVEEEKPESDEDDDEGEEEEEEETYGGFGSMPLSFIDAIAEADKYAEMLEQERNGEIQIVTRYRRSFQSRLIQSQGNVQDYYSILKNALLSYKGVKNRISWNYEAFNRGRVHVAKMNAKTKTLYLYLALDPEELKDTKYGIIDVSSKKKYASVPVLMKIKGERKFKYALELIAKLCGENLELPKLEIEEVDYRMPYQTTDELVEAGIVKKMVASIPVSAYGETEPEAAAEENTVSAATEAQDVTFIEPTTSPAVEEAAEEIATEEVTTNDAPVEEAVAEDIPADAPASEDESKEV